MRVGAITFVGYNTLFGLMLPIIDTAAHLGGLATGFACGLLMTFVSQFHAGNASRLAPALLRLTAAGAVSAVLALVAVKVNDVARARMLAGPRIETVDFASALNAFNRAAHPLLLELDRIAKGIDNVGAEVQKNRTSQVKTTQALDRLKADCTALGDQIATIPADGEQLLAIRNIIASAQSHQLKMLNAFSRFIATGEQSHVNGPDGFTAAAKAYVNDVKQTVVLRDAYIKNHQLQILPSKSSP